LAAGASFGAIAIASIAAVLIFREPHQVVARTNTIVVLPFKNVDGNTADDYLADAITDDLTTELSRLRRAWVIASGTAFVYKGKPTDPRQVGRELQVRYALEGSVKRAGLTVQVNAQLIDTESGTNLWANRFAHETGSLLDLQDKLLERIATSLNDEMTKDAVRHEVGTLAADANPLDERMRAMAANTVSRRRKSPLKRATMRRQASKPIRTMRGFWVCSPTFWLRMYSMPGMAQASLRSIAQRWPQKKQ
jgi:adenylate cyclase